MGESCTKYCLYETHADTAFRLRKLVVEGHRTFASMRAYNDLMHLPTRLVDMMLDGRHCKDKDICISRTPWKMRECFPHMVPEFTGVAAPEPAMKAAGVKAAE
jgi:hypothetical protein